MSNAKPQPGKKRLFFALWPDADGRAAIANRAVDIIPGDAPGAVPADNYHITLAFLGTVSAASVPDIIQVARSVRFLPFTLELDHCGYWRDPKVAWLAPSGMPLQLADLVDNLWNKLAAMGFQHEVRQYRPHVTLSRRAGGERAKGPVNPIIWRAASFVLVESQPGKTHPVYTVLEQFPAGA